MDGIKRLKEKFLQAGGSPADFESLGRGHLELGDTELQDGSTRPIEARAIATKCLQQGALVQMSCYDGESVIIFEHWLDKSELVFRGQHLVASDEYYEWWATHDADFSRIGFHICEKPQAEVQGGAYPRGRVVHRTKWRMASPQTLIGGGFASTKALAYVSNSLDYHLATLRAPAAPEPTAPLAEASPGQRPGGAALHTTGLDAVDDGGGGHRIGREADEAVDELLAMAQGAKKEPVAKKKGRKEDQLRKGPQPFVG